MLRVLRRSAAVLYVASLVLVLVVLYATVAAAADTTNPTIKDLTDQAQLFAWVGGVLIPFVVALLTKAKAALWVKSLIAVAAAGLLALGTYLANANGAQTWRGALSVFVIAVVSAAASRYTITGGADTALQAKTYNFGLG